MERIGPYEVQGEVARGGMGVVFRGRHPDLDRPVAIKLLLAGGGATEVQRKRFLREARALARLCHPHVVRVFDAGEHQGVPFMVQEWVEGESLQDRLDRAGPLPVREALAVARDLADALAQAHASGVLHRDVKPANVLLRAETGAAVLTDFGLTRDLDPSLSRTELTLAGRFLGTPGYWPPEQARGETSRVGPWSDVYSLGATLHAALTGAPPHGDPSSLIEALSFLDRDPEPPSRQRPEIPASLDAVVLRCLARDPEGRFADAAELRQALATSLQPPRVLARPDRSPGATLLAAGVVALGLLSSGTILGRRRTGPPSESGPTTSPGGRSPDASPAPQTAELAGTAEPGATGPATGAARPQGEPERVPEAAAEAPNEAGRASPADAAGYLARGRVRAGRGDLAGAVADFTEAIALQPDLAAAYAQRGEALRNSGDKTGALADYARAVELQPDPTAYCNLGLLRLEQGDRSGAVAALSRAIELQPDLAPAYSTRGIARLESGDPSGALADSNRAVELLPTSANAYSNRGRVRYQLGDFPGVDSDCSRAIELDPDFAEAYSNRGSARLKLANPDGAFADFCRAIELQPEVALHYSNRGLARLARGDLPGAVDDFTRAIELQPGLAEAYSGRGLVYYEAGAMPAAIADYSRAIELQPGLAEAHFNRGIARYRAGELSDAVADFSRALELVRPEMVATVHYFRGRARAKQDDQAGAAADFSRALELEPDASWANQARQRLAKLRP